MPELRRPLPPFTEDIPDPGQSLGYVPQARILTGDDVPADADVREDLLAVYIRDRGRWRPTVLTGWAPRHPGWAARLQLELGQPPVWIDSSPHVLVPVQAVDAVPER